VSCSNRLLTRIGLSRPGDDPPGKAHALGSVTFAVIFGGLVVFSAPFVLKGWQSGLWDIHTYVWAGDVLRAGDSEVLYTVPQGGQWDFVYPPAFASGWALITAVFGPAGVYYFWLLVCLGSVLLVGFLARRESGTWVVAATSPFLLYLVFHGQVGAIMVSMVIGTLWAVREDRVWLAACLTAMAVHLKLYPVVLIPALWIHGKPGIAKRALALSVAGCMIPVVWVGSDVGRLYLDYLHRLTTVTPKNLSLGAILPDFVLPLMVLASLGVAYLARSADKSARLAYAGVILSSPLVHPYTFTNLLLLYPLIERKAVRVVLATVMFGAAVFAIRNDVEYGWPGLTMIGWAIWVAAAAYSLPRVRRPTAFGAAAVPGLLILAALLHGAFGLPSSDTAPDPAFRAACERTALDMAPGDGIVWQDPPHFEGVHLAGVLLVRAGDSMVRSVTCKGTREGATWQLDVRSVPLVP
jgi:hypothetical protein